MKRKISPTAMSSSPKSQSHHSRDGIYVSAKSWQMLLHCHMHLCFHFIHCQNAPGTNAKYFSICITLLAMSTLQNAKQYKHCKCGYCSEHQDSFLLWRDYAALGHN